ncbi:MAG: amidohydrolase family protein [Hydrococcus sp. RM1_1_31]|nr:amidohydrolase family protein [Hydrococcus sp. RM1_1_31]
MLNFARLRVPFILGSLILVLTIILKYTSLSQAQVSNNVAAYRGSIFHLLDDPAKSKNAYQYIAEFFLDRLLESGTTTALVFGTVHKTSIDALFEVASTRNLRLIAGKVMMDRNAPDYLLDTPQTSYQDSKELIDRWHKKGRLLYAVTPRFAPTSTPEQLKMAGKLLEEYPDVYMHNHLSENQGEVEWVKTLFPQSDSYLGVYNDFKLSRERSIYAHSIHLGDDRTVEYTYIMGKLWNKPKAS